MLNRLIQGSLRHRGTVVALAALLLVYGTQVASRAKLDVFPDFVPPQATIQTEAPGLSPEQVEALVTRPVESALNGLPGQVSLRSESIQGLSIVTTVFEEGTDVLHARQLLAERLAELAGTLPSGVRSPRLSPLTSATMDLLKFGLRSERLSPRELRSFADWTVRPRLLAVPGVARCSVFGGEVRQLQVQVFPDRLVAYGLTIQDVLNAARSATGIRGAGFLENTNQRIVLQTEGQVWTDSLLGETPLARSTNGTVVRLSDVARVVEGAEPKFGDALVMGEPGVLMTLASQYGANTLEATRAVEAALKDMAPLFEGQGIELSAGLHRPATFIETALANIRHSLWLGALLVACVLVLFLGDLRTALISLLAIPLSLLTAVIILDRLGVTLNTITLGGLAIAIGEVVDDAIIDVENITRRLRGNAAALVPLPALEVVLSASLEVRSAVVYATLIVAVVFLPVLTLTGLQGAFFAPLAQSYLLAVMASLGVALTLTPALSLILLGRDGHRLSEPRFQSVLRTIYRRMLSTLLTRPRRVMAVAAILCLTAVAAVPYLGGEFLPPFREGHYVLQVSTMPGTSLGEMMRLGRLISGELLKVPGVATVEQQIGRAEQGEDPWGPHRSEFHVELKPARAREQDAAAEAIRGVLAGFPGIQFEVLTFLGDRIGESISGETSPVVVSLFGEDLGQLDRTAARVAKRIGAVPGAADVQVKSPPGSPRLTIRLRPDRLLQSGIHPAEVLDAVQAAYQGLVVAQTYHGNEVSGIAVMLAGEFREDPDSVGRLPIQGAQGQRLPLQELAELTLAMGPQSILHDGARRRQVVTCGVSGRDVASFTHDVRAALGAGPAMPAGVYFTLGGAAEAAASARRQLLLHSAIASIGILLLLAGIVRSGAHVLLVLANVPFALVGGVIAVGVTSWSAGNAGGLNLGSLVGFVTLFGITMRNSIMLVSHYEHLVMHEGCDWGPATVLRGAAERLVPIVMTALVTGLGLLPLALGAGEAGREIEGPMAVVILGGLVTSTLLSLFVLPTLVLRFGRFGHRSAETTIDG